MLTRLCRFHAFASFLRRRCLLPAILLCLLPLMPFFAPAPAAAQSRSGQNTAAQAEQPRRSFWDRLFGRHKQRPMREMRPAAPPPRKAAPPKAAAKNADARRVLVAGDFTAAALAEGLTAAYNDNPNILIRAKIIADSGLMRASAYDWPGNIRALSAAEKPNLIIIMLGANDRLPAAASPASPKAAPAGKAAAAAGPAPKADAASAAALNAYQARAAALAQALQKSSAAWLWIGLPPFKDAALNSNAAALNRLYQQAAEKAGGHFVSIWAGFADDKGNFALSGYDINGRIMRLRANDGLNFTAAGRRKLAFYAGQAIELLWGNNNEQQQLLNAAGAGKIINARVAPVNPLDIGAGDNAGLAGSHFAPGAAAANAAAGNEAAKAAPAAAPKGRADNFRLAPQ